MRNRYILSATTQHEINKLLDEPGYLAIVNASDWPSTLLLTLSNRTEYLNGVVIQEVMQMREGAIKSVCTCMEELGLVTLTRELPEIMKQVFVHSPHRFDLRL